MMAISITYFERTVDAAYTQTDTQLLVREVRSILSALLCLVSEVYDQISYSEFTKSSSKENKKHKTKKLSIKSQTHSCKSASAWIDSMVAARPTYPDLISMNQGNNNVDDKKPRLSIVSSKPFVSASGLRLSFKEENEKHEDREIDLGPNYEPSPFDVICAKGKDAKDHTGTISSQNLFSWAVHSILLERTSSLLYDLIEQETNDFECSLIWVFRNIVKPSPKS